MHAVDVARELIGYEALPGFHEAVAKLATEAAVVRRRIDMSVDEYLASGVDFGELPPEAQLALLEMGDIPRAWLQANQIPDAEEDAALQALFGAFARHVADLGVADERWVQRREELEATFATPTDHVRNAPCGCDECLRL